MASRLGVGVLILAALLGPATAQAGYGYVEYTAAAPVMTPEGAPTSTPVPPTQTPPPPGPGLRFGFYRRSCPPAEYFVKEVVAKAIRKNPGIGAGLIRMAFHDCFVQGCDGSVLLDATQANPRPEKLGPPNFPSLRGFEVIDTAKALLEKFCPGVVSCADVVQFAARDAAFFLSGYRVYYQLPAGRFDGRISFENETLAFLPPPSFNLTQLVDSFKVKGMNVDDLVVLSGSHTIGRSHCSSFSDRISTPPSDMEPGLATILKGQCPANPNFTNDPTVVQDIVTPDKLDNQYYKNVLNHKVLFNSDAALLTSRVTTRKVQENALIRGRWERKFARAMVKMSLIEIKTAANGEIRKNCHVVN
jgi:peroxidase